MAVAKIILLAILVSAWCVSHTEGQVKVDVLGGTSNAIRNIAGGIGGMLHNILADEPGQRLSANSPWQSVCMQDCASVQNLLSSVECQNCCNRFIGFTAYTCMGIYYHIKTRYAQQENFGYNG